MANFWRKLGKTLLTAAPYIAAPFTGGASLLATGLANKAVSKWSEKNAISDAAKGLAPSKFDARLGKIGQIASIASSFIPGGALGSIGMLGKVGSVGKAVANTAKVAGGAQKMGGFVNALKGIGQGALGGGSGVTGAIGKTASNMALGALGNRGGGQQPSYQTPSFNPYQSGGLGPSGAVPRNFGSVMPRGGYSYDDNPMNQLDQNNPNLSMSIFQGRQAARRTPYSSMFRPQASY